MEALAALMKKKKQDIDNNIAVDSTAYEPRYFMSRHKQKNLKLYYQYLCYGYIRLYVMANINSYYEIPIEIINECTRFYPNIEMINFSKYNPNIASNKSDGILGCGGTYPFFGDKFFTTKIGYNQEYHQWNIKYVAFKNDYDVPNYHTTQETQIGIRVKRIDFGLEEDDPSARFRKGFGMTQLRRESKILYFVKIDHAQDGVIDILSSGNCHKEITKRQVGTGYKVGDVITVCLDCNKWTITFLKNGNRLCDVEIDQNAYFPFISFTHPFHKYQAIM
eukprot:307498_1